MCCVIMVWLVSPTLMSLPHHSKCSIVAQHNLASCGVYITDRQILTIFSYIKISVHLCAVLWSGLSVPLRCHSHTARSAPLLLNITWPPVGCTLQRDVQQDWCICMCCVIMVWLVSPTLMSLPHHSKCSIVAQHNLASCGVYITDRQILTIFSYIKISVHLCAVLWSGLSVPL